MSGKKDEVNGRIKEAVGALTGNDKLREEGKTDQAVGKTKQVVQKVADSGCCQESDGMSVQPLLARSGPTDERLHPKEGAVAVKGFVENIESLAVKNEDFRRVLYTAKNCQLVVMSLKPKEEIGAEVHTLDQFFRVEEGTGEAILDGARTAIQPGFAVLVPAGAKHNIINTGSVPLKLYTLYAPPNHRDGVVHHTRVEAEADDEQFDGKTTEWSPR